MTEVGDGVMRGRVAVRDEIKQPAGLVHGGVYAAVAESLATTGTALTVFGDGKTAMGLSNQTSFLRPIIEGHVHAEARARAPRPDDVGVGGGADQTTPGAAVRADARDGRASAPQRR